VSLSSPGKLSHANYTARPAAAARCRRTGCRLRGQSSPSTGDAGRGGTSLGRPAAWKGAAFPDVTLDSRCSSSIGVDWAADRFFDTKSLLPLSPRSGSASLAAMKSRGECVGRAIADEAGDFREALFATAQMVTRECHPPVREVSSGSRHATPGSCPMKWSGPPRTNVTSPGEAKRSHQSIERAFQANNLAYHALRRSRRGHII
jgi:hypothetical protein